jgi:hypothetical protein
MNFRILLLLFICINLSANSAYDLTILTLQSKVFPKIILADKNISKKLINNTIEITILYEEIDIVIVNRLKKSIEQNYPKLKDFDVVIKTLEYKDFSKMSTLSSAYFFLSGKENDIVRISNFIIENKRLSFCYEKNYVDLGIIFGLQISSTVSLLLNFNSLKLSGINLENSIFKVTKIR